MNKFLFYVILFISVSLPFQIYFPLFKNKHGTLTELFVFLGFLGFILLIKREGKFFQKILKIFDRLSIRFYLLFVIFAFLSLVYSEPRMEGLKLVIILSLGLFVFALFRKVQVPKKKIALSIILATFPMFFLMIYIFLNESKEMAFLRLPITRLFIEPDTLEGLISGKIRNNVLVWQRVGGFFVNTNVCSTYLGLILSLLTGLFFLEKNKRLKFLYSACFFLTAVCIYTTGSLNGFISFLLFIVVAGIVLLWKGKKVINKKFIGGILALLLVFSFVGLKVRGGSQAKYFLNKVEKQLVDKDFSGRQRIWWASTEVIKKHWILGVGLGGERWNREYNQMAQKYKASPNMPPHNMYLYVWGSCGILAFSSLLLALFFAVKESYEKISPQNYFPICGVLASVWILSSGLVENLLFTDPRVNILFWIIIGLTQNES